MAVSSTVGHISGPSRCYFQHSTPCIHSLRLPLVPGLRCSHHKTTQQAGAPAPLQEQQQQWQQRSRPLRRAAIIAAAGRRRRTQSAAEPVEDEQPALDLDDVMYGTDDVVAGEAEDTLLGDDDEVEAPEAPDFEEVEEYEYEFGDEDEGEFEEIEGEGEEQLEGWDAALANFDAAQDAAVPAPPTKEEQEMAAALAMVRFNEAVYDEDEDAPSLEVLEVPPPVEQRPKTFDEQTALLAPADKEALFINRQSYASFPMDGIDLLISETEDGRMLLSDAFILNQSDEMFARPTIAEDVPTQPALYQLLPWEHTQTGDTLKRIDPIVTLARMYFVGVSSVQPWVVDMSQVYSFDAYSKTMVKHEVQSLGGNMVDPVLRIREDGIFIEDSARLPGTYFVAEGFAGHPEEQYTNPDKEFNIRDYVRMGWWPERGMAQGDLPPEKQVAPAAGVAVAEAAEAERRLIEERLEELELMEELDDMPDVPAVDMVD